jgi:hypothetical protein
MKPVIRYQSQLLFRKSYKPNRVVRIRPAQRLSLVFRLLRTGRQIKKYECETAKVEVAGAIPQMFGRSLAGT